MEELSEQFTKAQKEYQDIDGSSLSSSSREYQQQVKATIDLLASVQELIDQLHVFSSNEELDDIASDHIKYILTPYYQAKLQSQIVDERLDHLSSAQRYFAQFIHHCEKLKLIHKEDLKTIYSDNPENPTDRRATVIARTKREKEIRVKMEEIQKQISSQAAGSTTTIDEELHRNNWIAIINFHIIKAITDMESNDKELKMLDFVAQRPPEARDSRGNVILPRAPPPTKPNIYTILPGNRRQELTSQVFNAPYTMASITPEQAADAEIRAGRMLTGGGGGNDKKAKDSDEEDDDDDDEKVKKARAWDDFKDDHPYGSGNTKR